MIKDVTYSIKSAILGHAVADALGVPVEFQSRESLDNNPVTHMRGYGTYPYGAGAWSDDTSMTLCALDSLAKGRVDWNEIMNNFASWLVKGDYSSVDLCFDVGGACAKAIRRFLEGNTDPLECADKDEYSNGNGSLMRIIPFALYVECGGYREDAFELIHLASSLTHAHERSLVGCGIYSYVIRHLLHDPNMDSVSLALKRAASAYCEYPELEHYKRIFAPDFKLLPESEIKSSGYVVDTLEAALWCLMTTDNYKDCVLKAVNLGEDTDTVGAVAGGLAGLLYGYDSIPSEWLNTLMKREYIEAMCVCAAENWTSDSN